MSRKYQNSNTDKRKKKRIWYRLLITCDWSPDGEERGSGAKAIIEEILAEFSKL